MLYLDPGAGSVVLQMAAAAVVGSLFFVRRWWGALRTGTRSSWQRLTRFRNS
jgi:hypothetical protein